MILHIDENKIEQFVLEPEIFNYDEQNEILAHINSCSVCKEIYDTYNNIYADLSTDIKRPVTTNDEEIARRIYQRLSSSERRKPLSEKATTVQIYNGRTEIVEKRKTFSLTNIYYLVKTYPIHTFSFVVFAAFVIAFAVGQIKSSLKDNNPYFVDVKNYKIIVYNKSAEILWTKTAAGIPKYQVDSLLSWVYPTRRYLSLLDIDSNGKNVLLVSGYSTKAGFFQQDSVYCFNSDGSLRWVTSPEDSKFNYTPSWKRTKWIIRDFFTVKTKKGNKLFLIANDETYGGTVVSSVNPVNGKITSSIYHSGWMTCENNFDLDGDGNDEIILGGTSSFQKPFIMVLNSENNLKGVMPDHFNTQKNPLKGNAEYYILFPVSDLGKTVSVSVSYDINEIKKFGNNGIEVATHEAINNDKDKRELSILYAFNNSLKVQYITPHVHFVKLYSELFEKHILKRQLDSTYWKAMKDSIQYWDGDKFVNYPTKNKYWDKY